MDAILEPARPADWPDVFRLNFRHAPAEERETRIRDALDLLERRELNPDGFFVLRERERMVGTVICLPLPGAVALVWPPQCLDGPEQVRNEDRLLQHASLWLRGRGIKLAQSLFPPEDLTGSEAMERNGYGHLTYLELLRRSLDTLLSQEDRLPQLEIVTAATNPVLFTSTMLHTYEGTLDCPEINSSRSIVEILEGHRSQGIHDPDIWWLALHDNRPVGVLLATQTPGADVWDVMYLGIVPEARRQHCGRALLMRFLRAAKNRGLQSVTLSMDGRNYPAARLYRKVGFESCGRREVFLAIWT